MQIQSHELAVCSWSLPAKTIGELVESVRDLGLSHLQLALGPLLFLDDKQKHQELGHLRESGLTVTAGMIAFPGEDYSTIARIRATGGYLPDETWNLRKQITIQAGKLAQELGLTTLTTHIGFIPQSNHDDYPRLIERIADITAGLSQNGVTLAMETGQEGAPELLQFLNDLPARNLAVNFDPANMILYGSGDPIQAVRTLGRHIRHAHLKDAVPSEKPMLEWGSLTPLGQGGVDFEEFFLALRDVGYKGPLAIEQESRRRRVEDIRASIEYLKRFATPV
jgi:sugar phosphate isomerase/epimerase